MTPAETRYDDVAFWLYSSGTTGPPKGVIHLQHNLPYVGQTVASQTLGINENDLVYSTSKLFFAYGLGNSLAYPFTHGAAVLLDSEKPTPEYILSNLNQYRPTVFCAVPALYSVLLKYLSNRPDLEIDSVRRFTSAGEMLPPKIFSRWKAQFGREILDGIGSTEMMHIFIMNHPGRAKAGSSGQPVSGFDVRIVDSTGRSVPNGDVGDLMVRGESAALGYWRNHQKSKRTFRGEWVATGDKYTVDEDGYYWFIGRSDDLFKVAGRWVSPVEIEAVLLESSAVQESAVLGKKDAEGLIKPVAFIVIDEQTTPEEDVTTDLRRFVEERLPRYKRPTKFVVVDSIPKTHTGKKQRFKLRSLLNRD